jgi:hypothetical protein
MKNDVTSSRNMHDVLKAPDKLRTEVRGVSGVLAYLWRTVLLERNISFGQFDTLCMRYIQRARRAQSSSKLANYFNRSNIFREMSRPIMTFKVFVKAMQLIGIKRMKITVELEGHILTTTHSATMTLGEEGVSFDELIEDSDEKREDEKPTPDAPGAEGSPPSSSGAG